MKSVCRVATIFVVALLIPATSFSSVDVVEGGRWPYSWPSELNVYRDQASTSYEAAADHQTAYHIAFQKRDDFEKAWPHILRLLEQGSRLTLLKSPSIHQVDLSVSQSGSKPELIPEDLDFLPQVPDPREVFDPRVSEGILSKAMPSFRRPSVRILCPSDGRLRLQDGRYFFPRPPWPDHIKSNDGALPEYVYFDRDTEKFLPWRAPSVFVPKCQRRRQIG